MQYNLKNEFLQMFFEEVLKGLQSYCIFSVQ